MLQCSEESFHALAGMWTRLVMSRCTHQCPCSAPVQCPAQHEAEKQGLEQGNSLLPLHLCFLHSQEDLREGGQLRKESWL